MSQPSDTPEQPQIDKEVVKEALQEILNEGPAFKALLAMKPAKSTAASDPPDDSESSPHGSGNGGLVQSLKTGTIRSGVLLSSSLWLGIPFDLLVSYCVPLKEVLT